MKAVCISNQGYINTLTVGRVYEGVRIEQGIFSDSDYIVIPEGDNGEMVACYSWRFQVIND